MAYTAALRGAERCGCLRELAVICRYPVLRLLGAACALVLYIAAGVFYGYSGRLVPLGASLASVFPGTELLPAPAHSLRLARTHNRLLHLIVSSSSNQLHYSLGQRTDSSRKTCLESCCKVAPLYEKRHNKGSHRARVWACGVCKQRPSPTQCLACSAGLLMLPHLKSERYEWCVPFCAIASTLVLLVLVPVAVYMARLPLASC